MAAKKHQRRSVPPTNDSNTAHGEVRFSTRKAAKVSNYNEEDDDDMFDDESDMLPQSYYAGPEENVQAIDAVLNHRKRNEIGTAGNSRQWNFRLTFYRQRLYGLWERRF